MINFNNNYFYLGTNDVSYILHIDETKHLVLDYFGKKIKEQENYFALVEKWPHAYGLSVIYDKDLDQNKSLDLLSLEYSTPGKGDFNEESILMKDKNGYVFDFIYDSYKINKKATNLKTLPTPHNIKEELVIILKELSRDVFLDLHYLVDEESNVICRNVVVRNLNKESLFINKISSYQISLINNNYELLNLYGGWIAEGNKEFTPIKHGIYKNDSKTGGSSARHNPFFIIKEKEATLRNGDVYAFNLIYSGNHEEITELTTYGKLRIQAGISSYCFEYEVEDKGTFETPWGVLTFSSNGLNGASQNMHKFVNKHVIRGHWANKERPIIVNNWEATNFKFDEQKIISLARIAKRIGAEMFVLDDGWFSTRDNDHNGLGDYDVNLKKLPHGLKGLAKSINRLGLKFGLWMEPEAVNPSSKLYKAHPEYAIHMPKVKPSQGRNQYTLDLTKKEVREYIIENINNTLKSANIEYVKWDMNRCMSDIYLEGNQGEFYHRYIMGLYEILERVTKDNPNVLWENCASGGNRHDLGMLSYMQQSWVSDDTDSYQRVTIQSGIGLGYPLSTMKNHISTSPSQQLVRKVPLITRFNVAAFGVLGYEMDLSHLTNQEIKKCKEDTDFYRKHRKLFQYGNFYQLELMEQKGHASWMVINDDKKEAIVNYVNSLQSANPITTILRTTAFDDNKMYTIDVREVKINLKIFGSLVNMVSPVRLNENGAIFEIISRHYEMNGEKESYVVSGSMLNNGAIKLNPEWAGVGYSESVRLLGDFGSRMYYIKELKDKKE